MKNYLKDYVQKIRELKLLNQEVSENYLMLVLNAIVNNNLKFETILDNWIILDYEELHNLIILAEKEIENKKTVDMLKKVVEVIMHTRALDFKNSILNGTFRGFSQSTTTAERLFYKNYLQDENCEIIDDNLCNTISKSEYLMFLFVDNNYTTTQIKNSIKDFYYEELLDLIDTVNKYKATAEKPQPYENLAKTLNNILQVYGYTFPKMPVKSHNKKFNGS